jgi:Uma2 family endonuclease
LRCGVDRWDEMWEGVLHMSPAPSDEHQRILTELIAFLLPLLKRGARGILRAGINVFRESGAEEDYRIPDLTFVAAGREAILRTDGVRGGGPDAVIEIRSPGDESYEKLAFFAGLGVREVVVLDRDSKRPEVFRLLGTEYRGVPAEAGWVDSRALGVRFQADERQRLVVEDLADPAARCEI